MQKTFSREEILKKLMRYCAYQERSVYDVREKMRKWQLSERTIEEMLQILQDEGFVDDQRFAEAFVRGKFSSRKWGRNKIKAALYAKKIPGDTIDRALREIDEEDYENQLFNILHNKRGLIKASDDFTRKQKLALYAQSKGYELDLIWKMIQKLNTEQNDK